MRSFINLFIITILFHWSVSAQITIDQNDMPDPGDTVRLSTALLLPGNDPAATGANYNWDYSGLIPVSQALDTFISVSTTPLAYQLYFNSPLDPNKATIASPQGSLAFIPGFEVNNVFEFYRETSGSFSFLGFGGELQGIPLPVKFTPPDVLYTFPLTPGKSDSSNSQFSLSLPGLGAVLVKRFRRNLADGYGTLVTPYGTFQTLRIKSVIEEYDSIYLDTLSQGIAINRNYTEYKWLGKGFDAPLLSVTVEGPLTTITYLDSNRNISSGTDNDKPAGVSFRLYPNPASDQLFLEFKLLRPSDIDARILSLDGRVIYEARLGRLNPGITLKNIPLPANRFTPGFYLVEILSDYGLSRQKVLITSAK